MADSPGANGSDAAELLARWRQGDEQAAAELFHRYLDRLIALARSRLSDKLATRLDPEDVVQSAYRSFFHGAKEGRYDLQHGMDLWQLLVVITLHKLHHQVRRNLSSKRAVGREQPLVNDALITEPGGEPITREPSPLEALTLVDELEQLMRPLDASQRQVLELRLQGFSLEEIVTATGRSLTTVRRILQRVKQRLEPRETAPTTS
jgi:RNA polymerase sigma-70 factor (ECF subfamily)